MKKASSLKIGISGVRGILGDSLTPQLAAALAQAFGAYLGGGPVVVGRDARASGEMIGQAVLAGLLSVGCQPVEIGIAPIPSFLFYVKDARAGGGISVTASHNPKEWNGLKFAGREGLYLSPPQTEEFLDLYHQGEFPLVPADRLKAVKTESRALEPHLRKILGAVEAGRIRERKFKVVIDCNNGAGAVLAPRLLEALGCEAVRLNADPSGEFAHDPEPLPENIGGLCRAVAEHAADVGFVQDADADRLAVVDETGRPIGEELTLAVAARYVLGRKPGPIVCNLSSSRAMDDIARSAGVPCLRSKIGEVNVVEKLLAAEPRAVIGGEGNGGVIYPEVHPCRDSFTAMALILEAMAAAGRTISELARDIPPYVMIKDRIPGSAEQAHRLVHLLKKRYEGKAKTNILDGLKVDFPDHWIHIRPSNTEPVIRILAEARAEEAARRAIEALKAEIADLQRKR
ncbi:MAG: phosphoglucosamine mutase [Candidatus Aminicenantes bacterium]|nr:phosphoglucosamine mutase [Candidatus Aminicenantes bacterium]